LVPIPAQLPHGLGFAFSVLTDWIPFTPWAVKEGTVPQKGPPFGVNLKGMSAAPWLPACPSDGRGQVCNRVASFLLERFDPAFGIKVKSQNAGTWPAFQAPGGRATAVQAGGIVRTEVVAVKPAVASYRGFVPADPDEAPIGGKGNQLAR
jgi:hypothetical protein